jgi:small multidrug resistance family-3 protein
MTLPTTLGLYAVTAVAEILGCYLPYLWLREGKSVGLLIPAAMSTAPAPTAQSPDATSR